MTPVYPKVIVRFLSAYKSGIKFKKNLYPKVVNNMVPFNAESTKIQSPIHHPLNTVNPRASKDIISMCHICCSLFFHPRTVILSNTKCNYVNIYFQMDVLYATNCPLQINTDRNTATELSTNHSLHGKENHNISFLQQSILMIWRQHAW
jgi:hypothetical protein